MVFDKVHILFEQSGTFKKVFEVNGYDVTEYDVEKTENVDFDTDIFAEIDLEMKKRFISLFHAFCLVMLNIAHSYPHKGGTRGQRWGKGPSVGVLGVSRLV